MSDAGVNLIFDARTLIGSGFGVSLFVSVWEGCPKGIPDFGVKMPKCLMLSKEARWKIKHIQAAIRANLLTYSYRFPYGQFLPFKAYRRWKAKHDELKRDFERQRDKILAEYDSLPDVVRKEANDWITEAFRMVSKAEKGSLPTLSFYENVVSMVVSKAPRKKDLASLFDCDIRFYPYFHSDCSWIIGNGWPLSDQWKEIAQEGLSESIEKDGGEVLVKIAFRQFGQKCMEMLQPILESVGNRSVSHFTVSAVNKALADLEVLNFFDDDEFSRHIQGLEGKVSKELQGELESRLVDLLSYVNSKYSKWVD